MISKTVKPASYMRASFAFLIDSVIAIGFMFLTYFLVGENFMFPQLGYQDQVDAYAQYSADSGLATLTYESDGATISGVETLSYDPTIALEDGTTAYGYKLYEKTVWDYYTVFLPNRGDAVDEVAAADYYTPEYVTKTVYGLNDDGTGNDYYVPAPNGLGGFDFTLQPVLNSTYQAYVDAENVEDGLRPLLYSYRSSDSTEGLYIDALANFKTQSGYLTPLNACNKIRYLAFIPAILGPSLIFFFIIPIAVPNGKTLGKLILGLAVLGEDGYKARKLSIVMHYFIIMLVYEVLLLPDQIIGFPLFALLFLIDYIVLVLSKKHQSVHDMLSKTVVANSRTSVWFASQAAEEEYIASHPSSLAAQMAGTFEPEGKPVERRLVANDEQIAAADSVLDLSTISKNREEARMMTSSDDFAKAKTPSAETLEAPSAETPAAPKKKSTRKKSEE